MKRYGSPRLTAGLSAALIWALTAGSALFWALHAGGQRTPVDAQVAGGPPSGALTPDAQAVGRLLGVSGPAAAPGPDVVGRLALRGIVTHGHRGAALIAVDGKPAKPVRVGAALEGVDGGWKLQSVAPRSVVLAADGQQARLEMPPLSERASASSAPAAARPAPAAPGPPSR
jgi:general secretion pathway protein C